MMFETCLLLIIVSDRVGVSEKIELPDPEYPVHTIIVIKT